MAEAVPPVGAELATLDFKLRSLHASYHDMPGNLYGPDECGWEGCQFWVAAEWALTGGRPSYMEDSDD